MRPFLAPQKILLVVLLVAGGWAFACRRPTAPTCPPDPVNPHPGVQRAGDTVVLGKVTFVCK